VDISFLKVCLLFNLTVPFISSERTGSLSAIVFLRKMVEKEASKMSEKTRKTKGT
jgi:hypothetical protein